MRSTGRHSSTPYAGHRARDYHRGHPCARHARSRYSGRNDAPRGRCTDVHRRRHAGHSGGSAARLRSDLSGSPLQDLSRSEEAAPSISPAAGSVCSGHWQPREDRLEETECAGLCGATSSSVRLPARPTPGRPWRATLSAWPGGVDCCTRGPKCGWWGMRRKMSSPRERMASAAWPYTQEYRTPEIWGNCDQPNWYPI